MDVLWNRTDTTGTLNNFKQPVQNGCLVYHFSCQDFKSFNWNNYFLMDVSGCRYLLIKGSWLCILIGMKSYPVVWRLINVRYKKPYNQLIPPKRNSWNQNQYPLGKEKHLQIYSAPILGFLIVFVGVMECQNGFVAAAQMNIVRPHIPQGHGRMRRIWLLGLVGELAAALAFWTIAILTSHESPVR